MLSARPHPHLGGSKNAADVQSATEVEGKVSFPAANTVPGRVRAPGCVPTAMEKAGVGFQPARTAAGQGAIRRSNRCLRDT